MGMEPSNFFMKTDWTRWAGACRVPVRDHCLDAEDLEQKLGGVRANCLDTIKIK